MEDKKRQILNNEEFMARQLARRVIEKPVPAVWMILIPVFFVFYAWKIKQYANGLKDFAEHYLISRRRGLDAAFEAEQSGNLPEIDHIFPQSRLKQFKIINPETGKHNILRYHIEQRNQLRLSLEVNLRKLELKKK